MAGGRSRQQLVTLHPGRKWGYMCVLIFPILFSLRFQPTERHNPQNGTTHVYSGSAHLSWPDLDCLPRCALRFVSMVDLNPIKLTVTINQHMFLPRQTSTQIPDPNLPLGEPAWTVLCLLFPSLRIDKPCLSSELADPRCTSDLN